MKKATLLGFIGSVVILLIQVYYFINNLSVMREFSGGITHIVTGFLGIGAWFCIGYFFLTLYKKQK